MRKLAKMFQQIYNGKQYSTNIRNKHSIPNRFNNLIEPKIWGHFWWGRIKYHDNSHKTYQWMQISNQKQEKQESATWSLKGFIDPEDPSPTHPKYDRNATSALSKN